MFIYRQLAKQKGFRVLSEVTRSSNEPAFTSQAVHLHRLYMEYLQSARLSQLFNAERSSNPLRSLTYSASSVGSSAPFMTGNVAQPQQSQQLQPNQQLLQQRGSTPTASVPTISNRPAYTTSSAGALSTSSSLHTFQPQQTTTGAISLGGLNAASVSGGMHVGDSESVDDSSIAAKGLNIAFSLVNELLKYVIILSIGLFYYYIYFSYIYTV